MFTPLWPHFAQRIFLIKLNPVRRSSAKRRRGKLARFGVARHARTDARKGLRNYVVRFFFGFGFCLFGWFFDFIEKTLG